MIAVNFRKGDVIDYQLSGDQVRRAQVTRVMKNVKDGIPGFDAVELRADGSKGPFCWGYSEQVLRVVVSPDNAVKKALLLAQDLAAKHGDEETAGAVREALRMLDEKEKG